MPNINSNTWIYIYICIYTHTCHLACKERDLINFSDEMVGIVLGILEYDIFPFMKKKKKGLIK